MNALLLALSLLGAESAADDISTRPIVLVATHAALGDIARQVGGDRVEVTTVARPTWDLHSVEAKPSVFATLARADVIVHSGLDLELWADAAIKGSRNERLRAGQAGNIDASLGIKLLQVPENPSRADGDVHLYGNPHYWMDPLNGITIAHTIAAGLTGLDPTSAHAYAAREAEFSRDMKGRLVGWLKRAIPKKNTPIVVYHDSFPYLARRFGLRVVATVEPKPRIPPTQSHLLSVLGEIEANGVRVVVREPYHDEAATDFLRTRAGVSVVTLGTMPGFAAGTATYQDLIGYDLDQILGALDE